MKSKAPKAPKPGPKYPNVVFVRVDDLMLSELRERAETEDRDVSYIVRKAIEKYLEEKPKAK